MILNNEIEIIEKLTEKFVQEVLKQKKKLVTKLV